MSPAAPPWLYKKFPNATLHLFDPLKLTEQFYEVVGDRPYSFHQVALGAEPTTLEFNQNLDASSKSSFLERTPLTATPDAYKKIKINVQRLDDICANLPDLENKKIGLKIDTEGYELDVLKGAAHTLKKCSFIICEASVQKRFEDSYFFDQLVVFMSQAGYTLNSVISANQDPEGIYRFLDVCFIRRC